MDEAVALFVVTVSGIFMDCECNKTISVTLTVFYLACVAGAKVFMFEIRDHSCI